MGGSGTMARWSWYTALLALAVVFADSLLDPAVAMAQAAAAYEINPIGTDAGRRVDRYQITLGPGASLWDLGFNRLPLVAIEQGDQKVVELIEQSFRNEFPDRGPQLVKPGDSFVLEVPTGTFVSKSIARQGDRVTFDSFSGDRLTTFPKDPVVQYRLHRNGDPNHVEVMIQPTASTWTSFGPSAIGQRWSKIRRSGSRRTTSARTTRMSRSCGWTTASAT
jgi:hypothetical protein